MRLSDAAALTSLLARLSRPPPTRPDPRVREDLARRTSDGVEFDLYQPLGRPRAGAIALHGVTVRSRHDPRLVHFARSLAATGVSCAVPTLEHLSKCKWSVDDIAAIESVHRDVSAAGVAKPGIIGFSYGASYGLVAAARPTIARDVSFVLCFGACHSFADLLAGYVASDDAEPADEAAWDDKIYLHAVLAKSLQGLGVLEPEVEREAGELLSRYCHEATAAEKRRFYEEKLRGRELPRRCAPHWDKRVLDALSPKGQLASIQCPVSLLHDSRDTVVPPEHARRIHQELVTASSVSDRHRLLITPLLSHVTLADAIRWTDVTKLFRALAPVVGTSQRPG